MKPIRLAALAAALIIPAAMPALSPAQPAAPASCAPGVGMQFICGLTGPEDIVLVPNTDWMIVSGLANAQVVGSGGISLVGAKNHVAIKVPLSSADKARAPFTNCPGPIDPTKFSAHGLNIRPAGKGRSTLYVVGHGGREAIEIFDVKTTAKGAPTITWAGCIPAPTGAFINSVAPLSDGRVLATNFYQAPLTMADALQGKNTGPVMIWKPGGAFTNLPGTNLPGANGIEATPDRRYIFVAVTGTSSVMRYELANTEKPAEVIKTDFRTDNLRWGPDGKLLLAGPGQDAACKPGPGVRCLNTAVVGALDPKTMKLTEVLRAKPEPNFQGLSTALIVGDTIWLGVPRGDRIAYTALPK
ncbi:hypothetical protein BH11PSE2_BH11PSE2_11380 [soil metagenome]